MSTSTTRLAKVANARRRKNLLRKNAQSMNLPAKEECNEGDNVNEKENMKKNPAPSFDDQSTLSSGTFWSNSNSIESDGDGYDYGRKPDTPPMTIHSPSPRQGKAYYGYGNDNAVTPRRINANLAKPDGNPPKAAFSPKTPKMSGASPTITSSHAVAEESLKQLTQERDRLRIDSQMFKRKLQTALEERNATTKEKDDAIRKLESKLYKLAKELETAKKNKRDMESEANQKVGSITASSNKRMAEMQQQLDATTNELHELRDAHDKLNQTYVAEKRTLEEILCNSNASLENVQHTLQQQLQQAHSEKQHAEAMWKDCLAQLESFHQEEEEKYRSLAKREEALEQSVLSLRREKSATADKAKKDLLIKEQEVADLEERLLRTEQTMRNRICELEQDITLRKAGSEGMKQMHAKSIEGLRQELEETKKARDEVTNSLEQTVDQMNREHEEQVAFYKQEMESLRSQLHVTKQKVDIDKKELANIRSNYEAQLQQSNRDRDACSLELKEALEKMEKMKNERGSDLQLLESELEKTYASKVVVERELEESKRRLQTALHSLDEMAANGDQMRNDLEGIMTDFMGEKMKFEQEISILRSENDQQKETIMHLDSERNRHLELHEQLAMKAELLEEKLRDGKKQQEDVASDKEVLLLEIKQLKTKLDKATSLASSTIQPHNPNNADSDHLRSVLDQMKTEKQQLQEDLDENKKVMDQLRSNERSKSAELSKAQQTIQILKSKERYLESRVDSLANQISRMVQDYELRLGEARESNCSLNGGNATMFKK